MRMYELERRLAPISRRQFGVLGLHQILRAGGNNDHAERMVKRGCWARPLYGVYADLAVPYDWRQSLMVAVLGYGGAVVSGRAAAALWRFATFGPCRPEVTVPPGANARGSFAIVHRSAHVRRTHIGPLPVVTPEQAIIDIARHRDVERLGRIVDEALHGPLRIERLGGRYAELAHSRIAGIGRVRQVLEVRHSDGYVPPTTVLEGHLYRLLGGEGMPPYTREASAPRWPAGSERVDALLDVAPLIVEADGRRWHTRVADFENDKRRDNLAAANGHLVMRFGWADLVGDVSCERDLIRRAAAPWWTPSDRQLAHLPAP